MSARKCFFKLQNFRTSGFYRRSILVFFELTVAFAAFNSKRDGLTLPEVLKF